MAAHPELTKSRGSKNVSRSKKKPTLEPHPTQLGEQFTKEASGTGDVLFSQSTEASSKLQQRMGIGPLSTEEFQRAISQGLVDWKAIYERGKEENIRLIAYSLWENWHGNEAENWVQAESLINTIWDKVVSHVNIGLELNNYLNEHQTELRILV